MRTIPGIAFALACIGASDAAAQVRHCVTPEGGAIYTDRQCEALGATEEPVKHGRASPAVQRGGCTRSLRDLMFEVGAAIDANDPNRLAGLYHWAGMSTRQAYAVVGRLDAIVQRPLVDVVPLMPGTSGDGYLHTTTQREPVGLRIEQTLANGVTPSRTVFGLQRHYGCWWIRG
jgi:hypothetical protein